MTKITPDHLARGAFIYIRHRPPTNLPTIKRAGDVNMDWSIVLAFLVGRT